LTRCKVGIDLKTGDGQVMTTMVEGVKLESDQLPMSEWHGHKPKVKAIDWTQGTGTRDALDDL